MKVTNVAEILQKLGLLWKSNRCRASWFILQTEDPVCINDVDLNLYVPKAVEETGITVASPERFSTYTSVEKDGELFFFPVS